MTFAARIPPRLLVTLVRLDDERTPIAELCRRLGAEAEATGHTRPSYERVRELVHEIRRLRSLPPSTRALLAQIVFGGGATPRPEPSAAPSHRLADTRPGRLRRLLSRIADALRTLMRAPP